MHRRTRRRLIYGGVSSAVIAAAALSGMAGGAGAAQDAARVTFSGGDLAADSVPVRVAWLNDSSIVFLVRAMQPPAIAAARLQLQSWSDDTTANVAITVARDHAALAATMDSIAGAGRFGGVRPAIADSLLAPYDAQLSSLWGLGARDLGRRFIATQREAHERAIGDLAGLASLARDAGLRDVIATRVIVMEQGHLTALRDRERAMIVADSVLQAARAARSRRNR
jgi:hypothetical protein